MDDKLKKLQELEAQRNDILTKLQKIEEKKGAVSFEVYEKVKKEYEGKLKQIEEKFKENVELVEAEIARLKEEDKILDGEEREVRFKIEEAELRYSIGEYDDNRYQELMTEHKNSLSEVTNKRKQISQRLKWLEGLLKGEERREAEITEMESLKIDEHILSEERKETEITEMESLKIDEHILEEKQPEEEKKIEELVAPEIPEVFEEIKKSAGDVSKKEEKGIACPKCGFLNAPDSWYCEKCGAEILSSLNL
ncbi:MAG: hypothetical protein ABIL70_03145 [candidate division WOR-3 bacterium]